MASPLETAIQSLNEFGFFTVMLPFLLVFSIIYGVLERTKIFGDRKHDINAVIAFSIGLIVIATTWVVGALTDFLPFVGFFAVVVVVFLMLVTMFYGEVADLYKSKTLKVMGPAVVVVAIAMTITYIFGIEITSSSKILGFSLADFASIAGIFIFFAIVAYIAKPPKTGGD